MLHDVYFESMRPEYRKAVIKAIWGETGRSVGELNRLVATLPAEIAKAISLDEAERLRSVIEAGDLKWLGSNVRIDKKGRRRYGPIRQVELPTLPPGETCCKVSVRPSTVSS